MQFSGSGVNVLRQLVHGLISYEGTTTTNGAPDGSHLVCSELGSSPDYDGNVVQIRSGLYAGQTRRISGTTLGGMITPDSVFGGQIVAAIRFTILGSRGGIGTGTETTIDNINDEITDPASGLSALHGDLGDRGAGYGLINRIGDFTFTDNLKDLLGPFTPTHNLCAILGLSATDNLRDILGYTAANSLLDALGLFVSDNLESRLGAFTGYENLKGILGDLSRDKPLGECLGDFDGDNNLKALLGALTTDDTLTATLGNLSAGKPLGDILGAFTETQNLKTILGDLSSGKQLGNILGDFDGENNLKALLGALTTENDLKTILGDLSSNKRLGQILGFSEADSAYSYADAIKTQIDNLNGSTNSGTHSHLNNTSWQTVDSQSGGGARLKCRGCWLDMSNLTQNTEVRVRYSIDSENYRALPAETWTAGGDDDAMLVAHGYVIRAGSIQIQMKSSVGEGASRSVPYEFNFEWMEQAGP